MQSTHLSIEQFLSYISAPLDFQRASSDLENRPHPLDDRDVLLVWQDDAAWSRAFPVIVVKDKYLREFVAFVSTYVKTYAPFSAFFRIIPESKFLELTESLTLYSTGRRQMPHELIGIVIAEAFAQSGERATNISSLPIQACFATLSSSVLACFSAGYGPASIDEMIEKWGQTRRIISDDTLALSISSISSFWRIIFAVCVDPSPISENLLPPCSRDALESFLRKGELTSQDWQLLCQGNSQLAALSEVLLGSKEDRIAGLDRTVAILQHSTSLTEGMRELLVGAAASFVANGAMSYLTLTKTFNESYPAAALWFGFFTAFNRRSDVFESGESLGRHLESKIFVARNFFDSPNFDIDFSELQVIGSGSKFLRFRTQQTSSVTVEIIPMVQGRFRIGRAARPTEAMTPPAPISMEKWEELKFFTDRISRIVLGQSEKSDIRGESPNRQIDAEKRRGDRVDSQAEFFETKPKGTRRSAAPKKAK